ncbi:MAG: c-type cytochrome, partial [Gemmatimonadaceae bacterium]|nr:c-type cytochrome [Acetobacteraceae bacterium]
MAPAPTPGSAPAPGGDVNVLLASANPDAGKSTFARVGCVACHSVGEGGRAGLGPNLYGIMGAPIAQKEGYNYSAALKGKGGTWTAEEMDKWLLKPTTYAAGTKMSFAGIADAKARTDVIAYLGTLSANPAPAAAADAPK